MDYYYDQHYADLHDYVNNGAWDIIDCPSHLSFYEVEEGDNTVNVSQLTFTFVLRRKTLFYTVNLIVPCVLIAFLSVGIFYLPSDAGEKMTMCISVLLALVVFLLLVSKILPPTSETVPLISKYLIFTFIMNIFTILFTVIIINWNFRSPRTHRMSRFVYLIFIVYLPRLLLMSRPAPHERQMSRSNSNHLESVVYRDNTYSTLISAASNTSEAYHSMTELGAAGKDDDCPLCNARRSTSVFFDSRRQKTISGSVVRSRSAESARNHHENREIFSDQSFFATTAANCSQIRREQYRLSRRHNTQSSSTRSRDSNDAKKMASNFDSSSSGCNFLDSVETQKAIKAIRYIAAHLKNEDDYNEVDII